MIFDPEERTLALMLEIYRKRVSELEETIEDTAEDVDRERSAKERTENRVKNLEARNDHLVAQLDEKEKKLGKLRLANSSLHLELQAEREAHQKLKDQTKGES